MVTKDEYEIELVKWECQLGKLIQFAHFFVIEKNPVVVVPSFFFGITLVLMKNVTAT